MMPRPDAAWLGIEHGGAQLLVSTDRVRCGDDQGGLFRFFLCASARSRLRRCTLTPKCCSIASRHCGVVSSGILGLEFGDVGNHLGRDLVATFGAPRAREQTREPGRLQGILGFVKGWPGNAEGCGDLADGGAVDLMAPHHLVAHLDQVFRVEEWVAAEQDIADGVGMAVEDAILRQRLALLVPPFCRLRHVRLR